MPISDFFRTIVSGTKSPEDAAAQIAAFEEQIRLHPQRAASLHARAARLAGKHGLLEAEARHQYQLGLAHRTAGAPRKAETALARAAEIYADRGDNLSLGDVYLARAGVCLMDRRVKAAQDLADKAHTEFAAADALATRPQLTRLRSAITAMRIASGG